MGEISQEKAVEIAGLNRVSFINILSRYRVFQFQYSPEDVAEEIASIDAESCN
jgi:predicted HTH domain antitoxin